jgi:hypothetical protein
MNKARAGSATTAAQQSLQRRCEAGVDCCCLRGALAVVAKVALACASNENLHCAHSSRENNNNNNKLTMPLNISLQVFDQAEQVVEFPDNCTILTVKEWVNESLGIPAEQQRIIAVQGGKVLKNDDAVSSDKRFLKLKVVKNEIGGSL